VDVDLGGALFADGAGAFSAIATLPLADGYTARYRNFDIQTQKVDTKQARVVGAETVTVPAGTYKAWKVEIASGTGNPGTTTLWIDQATRKVVKIGATLPAMNGATLTSELESGS